MTPEIYNKIQEIKSKSDQVIKKKDIENLIIEFNSLEKQTSLPDFWNNQEEAQKIMQKLGGIKQEIDDVNLLKGKVADIDALIELADEGENIEEEIENEVKETEKTLNIIEMQTFLSGKYDKNNVIFSIHAGQGGTEACDWAEMLMRMYLRYFEIKGWKVEISNKIPGEEAGIKSVSFEVYGRYAYGYLKREHGTHRLVRVSPFNAQGLRQTSFAGVEVAPLIDDDIEIDLNEEDIEFSAVRSSGPGGQNVNKTSSSVRLLHKPTGISVSCSTQKSQLQNRKMAMNMLKAKLYKIQEEENEKELAQEKGEHKIASWGNQIRNYVLHPYKLAKDLRTGVETDQVEKVLDGDLEEFIQAETKL